MLHRLTDGVSWRWRLAARLRYLRRTFQNGEQLAHSYNDKKVCDTAVCRDGTAIRHPSGRTGLAGMILELWYDEVYTGRFYIPKPNDVVIDAGANIGLFSIHVARRQPKCRVFAYEPFEENFRILNENLAAFGVSNVRAFPFALAGESGSSAMIEGGERSQDHQLATTTAIAAGPTIRTCSFEEVLAATGAQTIQLFKCDIEGSERGLFASASDDSLRRCQRYAIEYHDNLQPGTLEFLKERLGRTHTIDVQPAKEGGYGMLYAVAKNG